MKPADIRSRQRQKPFRPFELELSSGTRLAVPHPENLVVGKDLGAVASEKGQLVLFSPDQVCVIHPLQDGPSASSRGGPRDLP